MMGSGKSYWSKKLSKKTKVVAYDLDELIEAAEERTITAIFREEGEDYFRKRESQLLKEFFEKKNFVLATGGGTPCYYNNMEWMNKNGLTIWVDEPVEVLVERLQHGKDTRPLIKQLSKEELHTYLTAKLTERQTFYSLASYHLKGKEIEESRFIEIMDKHA
jgi:shikimate kinase